MTFLVFFISTRVSDVVTEQGVGNMTTAPEIKNLSENSSAAANAISEVCKEMNANVENIKSCFGEVIRFMRDDVSAIFTDMHEISERLKNSMEEENRDMINELDGFIGKNMETVKDINAIVSRFES